MKGKALSCLFLVSLATPGAAQLPPPEDIPEEVLRMERGTAARSPINGQPLTAAEYAELQADLRSSERIQPQISPKLQGLMIKLRLLKVLRGLFPFL
ncbi:MAG: hypothetical protein KME35_07250 [Aphanocapsa sp. GSE-SYN-MK-11-07L]|jgi:hypothetical protein|nr:hypothetical protein [Aphanocapsa sp. GSE-SYN-MK-11-07L]